MLCDKLPVLKFFNVYNSNALFKNINKFDVLCTLLNSTFSSVSLICVCCYLYKLSFQQRNFLFIFLVYISCFCPKKLLLATELGRKIPWYFAFLPRCPRPENFCPLLDCLLRYDFMLSLCFSSTTNLPSIQNDRNCKLNCWTWNKSKDQTTQYQPKLQVPLNVNVTGEKLRCFWRKMYD